MKFELPTQNQYSEKYADDEYEYRHVILCPESFKLLPRKRLLTEQEWREIGVQMSINFSF